MIRFNNDYILTLLRSDPSVSQIEKIIFNDPCTILINKRGKKTIVRSVDEAYSHKDGYLLVIAKYLSDGKSYSKLIDKVFSYKDANNRRSILTAYLLGLTGYDNYSVIMKIFKKYVKEKQKDPKKNTLYFEEEMANEH